MEFGDFPLKNQGEPGPPGPPGPVRYAARETHQVPTSDGSAAWR